MTFFSFNFIFLGFIFGGFVTVAWFLDTIDLLQADWILLECVLDYRHVSFLFLEFCVLVYSVLSLRILVEKLICSRLTNPLCIRLVFCVSKSIDSVSTFFCLILFVCICLFSSKVKLTFFALQLLNQCAD